MSRTILKFGCALETPFDNKKLYHHIINQENIDSSVTIVIFIDRKTHQVVSSSTYIDDILQPERLSLI